MSELKPCPICKDIQEYIPAKIEQLAGKNDDTLHKQFDFQKDDGKETTDADTV